MPVRAGSTCSVWRRIRSLVSSSGGVGWRPIEHVSFLREPFDALLGDPAAIQAASQTWQNISAELGAVAGDYRTVAAGTATLPGRAGAGDRGCDPDRGEMG